MVDVSRSMDGDRLSRAQTALNTFIDAMYPCDNACLVKFNDSGTVVSKYGSSQYQLKSAVSSLSAGGNTSTNKGLEAVLDEMLPNIELGHTPIIILICDGDADYNSYTTELIARAQNTAVPITIYTVNVCNSYSLGLDWLALMTGGIYYTATTTDEIASTIGKIQQKTVSSVDMTDSDGDGLYDVYEVKGVKIQNGQTVYTDPYNPDSDNDGVSDLDELGGLPIIEILKFYFSDYSCVICKSKSNPLETDTDGDYYPDSIDMDDYMWNRTSIKDEYIDDTNSATGKNPSLDSAKYTNGTLTRISIDNDGPMKKNAYSFIRSNDSKYVHKGYSSSFSIRPDKDGFYAITVTNVNSIDDVNIEVTTVKDGFWFFSKDKTISAEQPETANFSDGEVTFYFYLELDIDHAYKININNNSGCSTYRVVVSQDNWVYAKDGGKWEPTEYSFGSLFNAFLLKGSIYMHASRILSSISLVTDISTFEINADQDIETQINNILNNTGMMVSKKDLENAIDSIKGATSALMSDAITIIILKKLPNVSDLSGIVVAFFDINSEVTTYKGDISALETLENYFEQCGFIRAYTDGDTNVCATKYQTASVRSWDPWVEAPYIYKFSIMGDRGKVITNITDQEIVDWCGWKPDEAAS